MKYRLRKAMRDALTLVGRSNVIAATAVIKAALSGAGPRLAKVSAPLKAKRAASAAPRPRQPLGEVIRSLQAGRAALPRAKAAKKAPVAPGGKGSFVQRSHAHAGGTLDYMLYTPPTRAKGTKGAKGELSLLIMLHGCTQDPADFAAGTRMNTLADEFGLVVAYPHQPRQANASGCWNWFDGKHQQRGAGEPAMLAALARSLRREFAIDASRTYAAGLSAGGAMAEILAATYPDQFAAIGIHSGLPYGAANSVMSAFGAMKGSVRAEGRATAPGNKHSRRIVFHGASDRTVHPSNGERIVSRSRRQLGEPEEKQEVLQVNGRTVTRTVLADGKGRPLAEHWSVKGAGHAWVGGHSGGSYVETKGPDASREMVRFFLAE